jgi:queuine/archaeosine tRNA-ribosyltransferase
MINAYDVLQRDVKIGQIHDSLSFDGEIFCDSGGWQILQGCERYGVSEILEAQRQIGADYSAVLDNGNDENAHIRFLRYYLRNADFEFVPILPYDMSPKNIEKVHQLIGDPDMIAIGKLVPILRPPIEYERLRLAMRSIMRIRKVFPNSRLHIFGLGGLYTILIFFFIADSTDSSSWIHDARYGKIRLVGGKGTFSTHPRTGLKHVDEHNYECRCPVCQRHGIQELDSRGLTGLRLRANHNAWVINQECEIVRERKKENDYFQYVQERLKQSPHHRDLLNYVAQQMERGEIPSC